MFISKKETGFILVVVLIFLQLYTVLGITVLEQVFVYEKAVSLQIQRHFLLQQAESLLNQLAIMDLSQLSCHIAITSAKKLRNYPLGFWETQACSKSIFTGQAYYVIEDLGRDDCVKNNMAAVYYRITILLTKASYKNLRVLLQEIVVQAHPRFKHCDTALHSVDWGPQSLHEI